jgi:hypothetical protein
VKGLWHTGQGIGSVVAAKKSAQPIPALAWHSRRRFLEFAFPSNVICSVAPCGYFRRNGLRKASAQSKGTFGERGMSKPAHPARRSGEGRLRPRNRRLKNDNAVLKCLAILQQPCLLHLHHLYFVFRIRHFADTARGCDFFFGSREGYLPGIFVALSISRRN